MKLGVKESEWNYRIIDTRIVRTRRVDENKREIEVLDVKVNLPFVLEVPEEVSMDPVKVDEEYSVMFKVYTAKLTKKMVVQGLVEFFKVIDIERKFEEFLKAAFIDESLFKFELIEIELAS
jgi:hypothetical protein